MRLEMIFMMNLSLIDSVKGAGLKGAGCWTVLIEMLDKTHAAYWRCWSAGFLPQLLFFYTEKNNKSPPLNSVAFMLSVKNK